MALSIYLIRIAMIAAGVAWLVAWFHAERAPHKHRTKEHPVLFSTDPATRKGVHMNSLEWDPDNDA